MSALDWLVIAVYFILLIAMAWRLGKGQQTAQDYYLAGRSLRWWQSGLSTMATQLSAVSFVSAPAFVALKPDGGLKWLAYEFAVPLALLVVMMFFIPAFHRMGLISIYEYLEQRFDVATRTTVSVLFQIGRGLATAVAVLVGGIILSTALAITTVQAILMIGLLTVLYDTLGGMRTVVLSDVVQMGMIVAGLAICLITADYWMGWQAAWHAFPAERLRIFDFSHLGLSSEGTYGFWPMVIGGFFLYVSYYGCDQSQVQRELTVRSLDHVRKSLMLNALGRFPLVLIYTLTGVLVGGLMLSPAGLERLLQEQGVTLATLTAHPDRMIPLYILTYLPSGVVGFLFAAIMAALMSSLDSGINSLSAVTLRDVYQKLLRPGQSADHYLKVSRMFTIGWGIFTLLVAILLARSDQALRQTTIVLINAMGSLLYGPILAAFSVGLFTSGVSGRAMRYGLLAGVLGNGLLGLTTALSWMWWNVTGFLLAALIPLIYTLFNGKQIGWRIPGKTITDMARWRNRYLIIAICFPVILLICWLLQG